MEEVKETFTSVVFLMKCHSPLPPRPVHFRVRSFGIRRTNLRTSLLSGIAESGSRALSARMGGRPSLMVSCLGLVGVLSRLYRGREVNTISSISQTEAKVGCIIVTYC